MTPVAAATAPVTRAFAHRGGRAHERENTLAAFCNAQALGIQGVETDAWVTRDGVPVLRHGGTLRTPAGRRRIRELERRQLPPGIASLGDLYGRCGTDLDIAIDVLDPDAAGPVVAAAVAAGGEAPAHLWLCSKDEQLLASWRSLHPAIHLVHSDAIWRRHRRDPAAQLDLLRTCGIDVLNLKHRLCTERVVRACHERGLRLFAWGVSRRSTMRRLRRLGLDGVMSDHVDRLLATIVAAG